MKQEQLSPFQLTCLIGNFIFTGVIISVPQILMEISKQNTWIVIMFTYVLTTTVIYIICRKPAKLEKLKSIFYFDKRPWFKNVFISVLFMYLLFIYIRDFRIFNSFIDGILLPDTPFDIIALLTTLTLIYISLTGIEVIARVTVIHFITISIVVILLPFFLLNEIQLANLLPFGGLHSGAEILKSTYIFFPWMTEAIVIVFLFVFLHPISHLKKAGIIGISCGFILLFILIFLNITVLGVAIASEATYPNIKLIQQINLTDFLDRLDLVIEVVWIPTMLCKLSLLLFTLNRLFNTFRRKDSDFDIVPLALLLSLTIRLFKNNIDAIEYSFFTWPTKGLLLELIIVTLFLMLKRGKSHKSKGNGQKIS
ncbi:hypothetical protein J27TS8_09840 [Robertmurraya siralis]|uniref:Spore germination protein n=1 Tax=Robertmurraya siralis TaxID=77777 RepID=A0A919WFX9_9BACI|nr:GerAB/ArcD/ProY family transporter [Robertmurraya siralis]PAE22597.1 hypothetical protein CHH80_01150 [Bacillus sp. 7504-2]GIN60991.1 hypothetical protein J27TS8_09840 [Robertmurraya siralis]